MKTIISFDKCTECLSKKCPYPCPPELINNSNRCLLCKTHCPCCSGADDGFCNQCAEENCNNRIKPYDPNSIQKEE